MANQEISFQADITYKNDPAHGWVPAGWKIALLRKGKVYTSQTAEVTSYTLNEPIPAEEFEIRFPPNSWVRDQQAKENYIVRPNGTIRPILKEELLAGKTFEELIASEPNKAK